MTTRFDQARDNLMAGLDACRVSKLLTEAEIAETLIVINDVLDSLEAEHPREESI